MVWQSGSWAAALQKRLVGAEVVEGGEDGEGGGDGGDGFAEVGDFGGVEVAEHGASAGEIVNFFRAEAHDAAGSGVGGDRIVGKEQQAGGLGSALDGTVAFHAQDAIENDEIGASGGADIEDGAVNTGPMEDVFGPAVATAGNDTEKILHGKSDAGPVVGFELGHGDEEVRAENGFRKEEFLEAGGAGGQRDALDIVNVEVAEIAAGPKSQRAGEMGEADGFENGASVAIEGGAVADEDAGGAKFEKSFAGGGDDGGVGVDVAIGIVADEIGLEEDGFVPDGETEFDEGFMKEREEVLFVAGGAANEDAGGRAVEGGNEVLVAKVHGRGQVREGFRAKATQAAT